MSRKIRKTCNECGSSMEIDDGIIKCSQDLIKSEYPFIFKIWDSVGEEERIVRIRSASSVMKDMYNKWKSKEDFICTHNAGQEFSVTTKSSVILPDPIQQKIAEAILKRPLDFDEYYGEKKVPLMNMQGEIYKGNIDQLEFPKDFTTKIAFDKDWTDPEKIAIRRIFFIEDL